MCDSSHISHPSPIGRIYVSFAKEPHKRDDILKSHPSVVMSQPATEFTLYTTCSRINHSEILIARGTLRAHSAVLASAGLFWYLLQGSFDKNSLFRNAHRMRHILKKIHF